MKPRKQPFDYREDDEYKQALEFAQGFEPQDGVDYAWVSDYGYKDYVHVSETTNILDEKADGVIKYLGAFSGIATIVATYGAMAVDWKVGVCIIPALVLSIMAISQAAKARTPMGMPAPPPTNKAIEYAEAYGVAAEAKFAPQIWAASEGMAAVNDEKSGLVRRSMRLFVWAVVAVTLPLLAALYIGLDPCAAQLTSLR